MESFLQETRFYTFPWTRSYILIRDLDQNLLYVVEWICPKNEPTIYDGFPTVFLINMLSGLMLRLYLFNGTKGLTSIPWFI